MRLALDTNVLVRYLVWDDEAQARRAAAAIEAASAIVIPTIVLCETVWVLRRAYRLGAARIAETLRALIATERVELDRAAAEAGLAALDEGGDFADGVILDDSLRAKADRLATFDRGFAEAVKSRRVMLLEESK